MKLLKVFAFFQQYSLPSKQGKIVIYLFLNKLHCELWRINGIFEVKTL